LFEAVDSFRNFKVNPSVVDEVEEVVFINEFLRDVGKFVAYILRQVEWCAKVEVADVEACKFCVRLRQYAIEGSLDEFD